MTAERSVVMFLCTLLTTVIVLVHARDATTTLEYDDPVPANETTARHRVDTESPAAEGRQGRVSLQTEPASSKAKREQTLHSILAARRRQMFGQRPLEVRAPNRTPRPVEPGLKDSSDLLEAQETRHGMYVTMSGGEKEEPPLSENEGPTTGPTVELVTKDAERQTTTESVAASTSTTTIQKNATTTIGPPSGPAAKEPESRKKNIVSMPESLYNYFRPVESNIPVEDMSQFLYFGQKIQPEPRNGTANDTLGLTTATSSRRRYSMKRLGLTTPLPQLEETNDEMNVAVERQSAQSPKVAKLKGPYRGPDGGPFYRKGRPTDPTIASNVIATADVAVVGNGTGQAGDPSAHAAQAQLRRERGSAAAHVAAETRNAAGGPGSAATQIPGRQPVSADADKPAGESEIGFRAPAGPSANGVDAAAENSSTDGTRSEEAPEMYGDHTEQIRRFDVYERGEGGPEQPRSRESNNIETSTSRDKAGRPPTTEPFRVEWTSPGTSTLRIIVTDVGPGDRYTVKPVESAAKRVRGGPHGDGAAASGAAELQSDAAAEGTTTATRPRHREPKQRTGKEQGGAGDREQRRHQEQQQQHVYAYTITNVTRLLRNYTGPGLSREEHGGAGGAAEITTGSALRRQPPAQPPQPPLPPPPPPSPPVLPRAGSGIEAGRAPAELSAGRTVEAVAAGRVTAGVSLVGERQRKAGAVAADGAPAQHHQHQLTVNKSGLRPSRPTEAAGRGAVRWNHTRTRSADLEGFGDRRFLRKSASAVLNQRIGGGQEEEVGSAKRRRLANGQPAASGRRLKAAKGPEDPRTWRGPVNGSVSTSPKDPGDEAAVSSTIGNRTPADSIAMEQRTQPSVEATEPTTTQQPVVDADNFTGPAEPDARARLNLSPSEKESVPASGASAPGSGSGSPTVTVTAAAAGETAEPPKGTAAGSPVPVFPVTPRIIAETAENETFTLPATGSVAGRDANQLTDGGAHGPGSFEVANMDPSEIQKMYRSKNVSEATTPATTVQIEVSTTPFEESTVGPDSRKRLAGERSPEVRGRNLSDKSRDKDDVLPIMQLYNDSDILNGSGPMHTFGPDRRAELPTQKPRVPVTTDEANETTAKTVTNETTAGPTRGPVTETTRKDRHEDNRESSGGHVPPTGPGRGSNRTRHRPVYHHAILPEYNVSVYSDELNRTFFEAGLISVSPRESVNISEVISKRHDGDAIASQETVAVVSYILATLVVFPIAVGVGLILRRLILRNRKVLEESDTSSEISCRKDALNLENGDFKTSIEKAITKLPRIQHLCHEAEKPPPPSSQESRWEFPRDKLRLQTVLGQGNFGQVWKAEADDLTGHQGTTRLVAVKTVKEGASDREEEDLVRELEIMQQLGSHPNVVTLLGCCTEQEPHYLILEYVMYGKLLAYLRDHRTRQDFYNFSEDSAALTSRDLTVFGYCVARGMEYLASKKIIHRDLAARNVLVDHNKLCKIADFGMSRFANENGEVIETRHGRNALPIRWMAPESLIYSLFTTKTDVWSFGILMWEIVTLGSTPYPDMTAREVMRNVQNGYRLERPSHCRSELFRVISRCWHADPERRPEFQTLRRDLAQLLEDNLNGHYVDLESFASECTD
ncbi:uncharacterized protein LOC117225703 [Megalopta genalis]|uniref:uncharacterized protein LOC117225703 n=1 Tax=Megalopta genalis TaxID=115081 RepID=UPI003FD5F20A